MTPDRKLLEDAARAAGMPHKWIPMLGKMLHIIDAGRSEEWNPLTDDGDALRLAVRLKFAVNVWEGCSVMTGGGLNATCIHEDISADPYAATRRAIVRAAAAMAPSPAEREAPTPTQPQEPT